MPDYQSAVLLNNSNKRTCRQSEIVIQQTGNNRISTPPVTHLSYRVAIRASIGGTQHNLITLNRCRCRCRNPLSGIVGNFKTLQWRGSRRCNVGNTIQRSRVRIRIIIGYGRARSLRIIGLFRLQTGCGAVLERQYDRAIGSMLRMRDKRPVGNGLAFRHRQILRCHARAENIFAKRMYQR